MVLYAFPRESKTHVVAMGLAAVGLSRSRAKLLSKGEGDETREDSGGELHLDGSGEVVESERV